MYCLGAIHVPAPQCIRRLRERASLHLMSVPVDVDWFAKCPADGDALGNDQYGDCDPVAKWRTIQVRRANAWGDTWKPTTDQALQLYSLLTGFDLTTHQPDIGTYTDKAMAVWATQGIRVDSQNLDVVKWATVDPADAKEIALAVSTTGPVQVSLNLPLAAQDITTWSQSPGSTPDYAPGSWGHHRVLVGALHGLMRVCRTWGEDVTIHPDFWSRYVLAVDATLSREWVNATGLSPANVDWDALTADMAQLAA